MVNIYVHTVMLTNNITIPVVSEGSWLLYVHICCMTSCSAYITKTVVYISTYSFSWLCSSLHLQPLLMNNLQVVPVVHKAIIKKKNNGEDSVGCWTVVLLILFLSSTPLKLHFES